MQLHEFPCSNKHANTKQFLPGCWPWCGTSRRGETWWNTPPRRLRCNAHALPGCRPHPLHLATSILRDSNAITASVANLQHKTSFKTQPVLNRAVWMRRDPMMMMMVSSYSHSWMKRKVRVSMTVWPLYKKSPHMRWEPVMDKPPPDSSCKTREIFPRESP